MSFKGLRMTFSDRERWFFLAKACLAVVLSLTTWFSATAIIPELTQEWQLNTTQSAWLTNGVQAGFVIGALGSSILGLGDRWRLNLMMAGSALLAASANLLLLLEPAPLGAILARVLTGVALSGVYPPAIKMMATWFNTQRGLALGLLIGALTLGSSLPHLVRAFGAGVEWQAVVVITSLCSVMAALIFGFALKEGPYSFARTVIKSCQIGSLLRDRPVMLANIGYFGHMWELYAMWGWFLAYARQAGHADNMAFEGNTSLLTFFVVAVGVVGATLGGFFADRIGRCNTTSIAMAISGCSALVIGFVFEGPPWLFIAVALIWGMSVIADSAQFSAAVTELSSPDKVGSALAFQMGVGFAITIIAIWIVPVAAAALGSWRWVFLILVPGPVLGIIAMITLRRHSDAMKMANGNR
jgi:MFS family permease